MVFEMADLRADLRAVLKEYPREMLTAELKEPSKEYYSVQS